MPKIKKGFTLIEVVAAIVIVTVGLISILQTFSMGRKIMALRQDRTAAANLLQQIMEDAKAKPFAADFAVAPMSCTALPHCSSGLCVKMRDCKYETIKQFYDTNLKLKRIDVSVTWSPLGWEPQRETITTMIAERY